MANDTYYQDIYFENMKALGIDYKDMTEDQRREAVEFAVMEMRSKVMKDDYAKKDGKD